MMNASAVHFIIHYSSFVIYHFCLLFSGDSTSYIRLSLPLRTATSCPSIGETFSPDGNFIYYVALDGNNPAGALYAHAVVAEDGVINGMLKGSAPLFASTWAGKTGLSEPMPMPGPDWEKYGEWAQSVRLDLPALKEYAQAVYANTDQYLASLTAGDLDRSIDLSAMGLGTQTVGWVIGRLIIGHADNLTGECSALKGLQGLRGYPE